MDVGAHELRQVRRGDKLDCLCSGVFRFHPLGKYLIDLVNFAEYEGIFKLSEIDLC